MVTDKHYVVFESPGTLFLESTSREIGEWSTQLAVRMAADISERYGARPFGFRFETRRVADPIDDGVGGTLEVQPKTIKKSGRYFINGKLLHLEEIKGSGTGILRRNMECNGWPIVCETRNSYLSTHPFEADDFVVDSNGNVTETGSDSKHVTYRVATMERIKRERGW